MSSIIVTPAGPPEVVAAELDDLPKRINCAVAQAQQQATAAVQLAIEAGKLLRQAKELVPHGAWDAWVRDNCTVAPRTARAYMRLADRWPAVRDEIGNGVAELPLREAIAAVACKPDAPRREGFRYSPPAAARARPMLEQCSRSVASIARDLGLRKITRDRLLAARDRLQAAMEEVDRLLGQGIVERPDRGRARRQVEQVQP